jgi:hypothetical protein
VAEPADCFFTRPGLLLDRPALVDWRFFRFPLSDWYS